MKTFKQFEEQNTNLLIVDALNLSFRYKHAKNFDFCDDYIRTIESFKKSYKGSHVIIACDKGSSTYRKSIYPEYKQNRKDKFAEQTEEEAAEFEMFFEEFERTIKKLQEDGKYPVFRFQGVEADDIAAYIVKNKKLWYPKLKHLWLISSDKDYDLLLHKNVSRFSYVTRKEVTWDTWHDHYECEPEDYISIKCLQGDSGDNVPGVPGIGPKKALQLVKEWGSCYDIIANMPIQSKYKYIQNLNEFGSENLMRNYKLMDLLEFCEEAIGEQNCHEINTKLGAYINNV